MKIIIKPCPFCGNPAMVRKATAEEIPQWAISEWCVVVCSNEGFLMHPKISFPDELDAIAEWNKRRRANPFTYDKWENTIEIEE